MATIDDPRIKRTLGSEAPESLKFGEIAFSIGNRGFHVGDDEENVHTSFLSSRTDLQWESFITAEIGEKAASKTHSHSGYAATNHVHALGVFDRPGGVDRWRSYITTTSAGPNLLTSDNRVKYLQWSKNSVFAIRVDNTWFYLTHSASDEKIKKNIEIRDSFDNLKECSDQVAAINLIEFDWDTEASSVVAEGHVDIGFSAQNLKSINPRFVIQPTPEDVAQINVSALLPYLVGALKSLERRIEILES